MADSGDHDALIEALAQYRKPQPELRAGDPSVFREPTLLNMLLGRYAPSAMLARSYNPDTREGAQWQRKAGGLLDDLLAPFWTTQARATGPMVRDIATAARIERNLPTKWEGNIYPEGRGGPAVWHREPVDPGITGGIGPDSAAGLARHSVTGDTPAGLHSTRQPIKYPDYDYQVHGDKGRWMNDALPAVRWNDVARQRLQALYPENDPNHQFGTLLRDLGGRGYGAKPDLPQYPRIPEHWVPENNPAKLTLRSPPGIPDRPAFTGETLDDILQQIARTELKPSDRNYLMALARQRFGAKP